MALVIHFPTDRCTKGGSSLHEVGDVVELPLMQDLSAKEAAFVKRVAVILASATDSKTGERLGLAQGLARARFLVDGVREGVVQLLSPGR